MPRPITVQFERIAFESALREHPGCVASKCAYVDWLCENGYQLAGAKRIAAKVIREEIERRQVEHVRCLIQMNFQMRRRVQYLAQRACNTVFLTTPEIIIIRGPLCPTWVRDGGYYRDLYGNQWETLNPTDVMALAARWVPLVEKITFGASWIVSKLPSEHGFVIV